MAQTDGWKEGTKGNIGGKRGGEGNATNELGKEKGGSRERSIRERRKESRVEANGIAWGVEP